MYSLFECAICQYFWRFFFQCNHFVIFTAFCFPIVSYLIFAHCFDSRQIFSLNLQCKILHTFIYATVYSISAHRAHHQLLSLRGSQATPHIDADSYGLTSHRVCVGCRGKCRAARRYDEHSQHER